jgi:hypothetical protein
VIAALAFYGMLRATQFGTTSIRYETLATVRQMTDQLDRDVLEVQGCVATLPDESCQKKVLDLKLRSASLSSFVTENLSGKKE